MTEKKVKDTLKKYLKSIGAYYYMPVPMGYGAATVDFLCCVPTVITQDMVGKRVGLFKAVETKDERVKSATARQACVLREIAEAGGGTWVENSVGLETTKERLK